jgi:hypothetical protein
MEVKDATTLTIDTAIAKNSVGAIVQKFFRIYQTFWLYNNILFD